MSKLYSLEALETLIHESKWKVTKLNDGCLLAGDYLLERDGYKSMVVFETYLNEWSSAYKVKRFDTNKSISCIKLNNLIRKLSN